MSEQMRLGLVIGYSGAQLSIDIDMIKEAEALGYDSVWTAEAWGSDAISPLAWIGAQTSKIKLGTGIMQIPGRSPANAAMTAMSMDALSGGRFIMGIGTSGPQVVEGWHGQPYSKPLTWMREYIEICRAIFAREAPLSYQGQKYQIPYAGPGSIGMGKPLKSILHGNPHIPIFTGSLAPQSQMMAGELADGVLLTCMNPERPEIIDDRLRAGFAKAGGGKNFDTFDVAPTVAVALGDDLDACRLPLKGQLALYIGGMGSRKKNFYKDYVSLAGFEAEAQTIQDLFLAGKRREAVAAVSDKMVDTLYLVGTADHIRDRVEAWKETNVGTLIIGTSQIEAVRLLAECVL